MTRYEIVDMFTDQPFTGSPLGVVPDAAGLSSVQMHQIAAELNCPETVFALPADSPDASYRVRVFTPHGESPFGGHSSVGTATTLVRVGVVPAGPVVQECGSRLTGLDAAPHEATLSATTPLAGHPIDAGELLAACGLQDDALAGPAATAGFGPLFHVLPVHEQALARAGGDIGAVSPDIVLVSWDHRQRQARVRLFAPGYHIREDPACAPAALALGAWLVDASWLPGTDGVHPYRILQGREVSRPATLTCTVTVERGSVRAGAVTGQVTPVASGRVVC